MLSNFVKKNNSIRSLSPVIITIIISLFIVINFVRGPLQGEFNHIILPAEKFGIPLELKEHGITELYKGQYENGWDGQFYYYISNDLLAIKDTKAHIDSPSYRYQRIGLAFAAKCLSILLRQSWVSPFIYYLTNLFTILFAVYVAAKFFTYNNRSPYLILLWSLGFGTQLTLLHGLPDAFADSMIIVALISLYYNRLFFYFIFICLSIFSREIYFIIPATISFCLLLELAFSKKKSPAKQISKNIFNILFFSLPCILFIGHQIYLNLQFGVLASSQASGVLGKPLVSAFHYLNLSIKNQHPLLGRGKFSYLEAANIMLFLALTILNIFIAVEYVFKQCKTKRNSAYLNYAIVALIPLSLLYLCFGTTVMMLNTGYFKAANIFLFTIPFIKTLQKQKINLILLIFLCLTTALFEENMWYKINSDAIVKLIQVPVNKISPSCLKSYKSQITLISKKIITPKTLFEFIFKPRYIKLKIKFKNLSNEKFQPFNGQGGITIGYHLIGVRAINNIAAYLPDTLLPDHSKILTLEIPYPYFPKSTKIQLSAVQLGCSWFDLKDNENSISIKLESLNCPPNV